MTETTWITQTHEIVRHLALVTPAVRTVHVTVYWDTGQFGHYFDPVLAIEVCVVGSYSIKARKGIFPREGGTHKEMLDLDWHYNGEYIKRRPLVAAEGLDVVDDWLCDNGDSQIVACPWPPAEDEERLAKEVERLTAKVQSMLNRKAELPPTKQAN